MLSWIIFYITLLNWEFLFKWYNFFETFVESAISCCVPRFPLILTAKFHSLYLKESEILERSEILESRSRIFYLWLRNPDKHTTVSITISPQQPLTDEKILTTTCGAMAKKHCWGLGICAITEKKLDCVKNSQQNFVETRITTTNKLRCSLAKLLWVFL